MKNIMLDLFRYEKRNSYPHMKPYDVALWERFIEKFPDAYTGCQYDYAVGSPPPFNPIVNDETMGSVDELYRRKIDVVGQTSTGIDIIELKPKAGMSSIGQVLGYAHLYKRDEQPQRKVRPVVITDAVQEDVIEAGRRLGVKFIIV